MCDPMENAASAAAVGEPMAKKQKQEYEQENINDVAANNSSQSEGNSPPDFGTKSKQGRNLTVNQKIELYNYIISECAKGQKVTNVLKTTCMSWQLYSYIKDNIEIMRKVLEIAPLHGGACQHELPWKAMLPRNEMNVEEIDEDIVTTDEEQTRDTAATDDADKNDTARVATQCTTATTTNAFIGVATSLTCDDITDQPIMVTEKTPANEARLLRNCPVDENYPTDIYEKSLLKDELCRIDDVLGKYNMCCVCLDPYVVDADSPSERRLPIKGACGHDLCETCLDAYFAQSLSGRKILRYIKCPLCNEKKAFDIQNKVTDHLLCDLLKARAPKTGSSEEDSRVNESSGTDGPLQLSLGVAMLRKKHEETEKEMTRLMKRSEELEKVASENAQLKRRIEELEACSVGNCGL